MPTLDELLAREVWVDPDDGEIVEVLETIEEDDGLHHRTRTLRSGDGSMGGVAVGYEGVRRLYGFIRVWPRTSGCGERLVLQVKDRRAT